MDDDISEKESHKSVESVVEEDIFQLQNLDEEFFKTLNEKIKQIIDSLEKRELLEYAEEVQTLLTVCNKIRDEWLNNEQKTKDAINNFEIMQQKLNEAFEKAQSDQDMIDDLKHEIEEAWKLADTAQLREQAVQDKMKKILGPVQKRNVVKDHERLSTEVKELSVRLQQQRIHTNEIESLNKDLESKIKELHRVLENNAVTFQREKKTVEKLSKENLYLEQENKTMKDKLKTLSAQNEMCVKNNIQQNLKIFAQKANIDRLNTLYNETAAKLSKILLENDNLKYEKENLAALLEQKIDLLKFKEEENFKIKQESQICIKNEESIRKKFQSIEMGKQKAEKYLLEMRNEFSCLEKEYQQLKSTIARLNKHLKQVINERGSFQRQLFEIKTQKTCMEEKIRVLQNQIKSLNDDIKQHQLLGKKQEDSITKMKIDNEKFIERNLALSNKISTLKDEIHVRDVNIADLKKEIEDYKHKIINIQNNLEEVHVQKSIMEQNSTTLSQEIESLKKQIVNFTDNIIKLKEEMNRKDTEIYRHLTTIDKQEKEFHHLKSELTNVHIILQGYRTQLKEKKQENTKLYKSLAETEISLNKLKKALEQCSHEKNNLNTHIIKKTEEVIEQKRKIELLQNKIDHEKLTYEKRLNEIQNLRVEIQNLESQNTVLKRNLENATGMKTEIVQLQRNLNQEVIKNKALQDEIVTPLNIHRWRNLSGKDPEKMELINRIQALQKSVLSQHVKVMEKDEALKNAHQLYEILKEFILKLPSYRVQEQLSETQAILTKKNKKMKSLLAELNAKDTEEKAKDNAMDELRKHLEITKRGLIEEKKKKQELLEERQLFTKMQLHPYFPLHQQSTFPFPMSGKTTVSIPTGDGVRMTITG